MAKVRSPVLGFNHNVKHLGWVFHVQTEDSGVSNPHLFTHLFHAGTILATKKMVYDANADVDVVKGLMQAQHKSVLKELKGGLYDAKIKQYLGTPPEAAAPAGERASSEADYDEIQLEATVPNPAPPATAVTAKPAPAPARPVVPPVVPPAAKAPDPTADVSAAFRAISHQSAVMTAQTQPMSPRPPTPSAAPPPATKEEAAQLVFSAPSSAPVPPGEGVFVGKPEITQERPFDRSGSYPAVRPPGVPPRPGRPSTGPVQAGKPPTQPPAARPPGVPPRRGRPSTSPVQAGKPPTQPPAAKPATQPPAGVRPSSPAGVKPLTTPPPAQPARPTAPTPAPRQAAATQPPAGAPTARPVQGAPNVVVARPAVIVGAPPQAVGSGGRPQTQRPREATVPPQQDSIFGKDLISEKSLDEVIMAYLSEDMGEE